MNKKILTLLFLITLGFGVQAQKGDVRFGFKAGYNSSTIVEDALVGYFDDDVYTKPLSGFHAGAFVEILLTRKFSIQPEVLYSTKGYKENYNSYTYYNGSGNFLDYRAKVHLNYINIPVLAKINFTKKFALEAGPQFGFLTNAKIKGTAWDRYHTFDIDEDIKNDVNTFEFGFVLGVTYSFIENVFASARINQAVTNNFPDHSYESNMVFQLSLGYKF